MNEEHIFSIKVAELTDDRRLCVRRGCKSSHATGEIHIMIGSGNNERIAVLPFCDSCREVVVGFLRKSSEQYYKAIVDFKGKAGFHV